MGCRSMCGPRFSPGRGFGRKSRRGSRDLAGAFPASMVCTRWASRAVLRAAGPRTGPRRQPLGIEGSCATRAFTAPIFRFSPRGASRGYEPWPLEPMAAAATSRTSKPQNDGISIIRAGRGSVLHRSSRLVPPAHELLHKEEHGLGRTLPRRRLASELAPRFHPGQLLVLKALEAARLF